MPTKRWVSSNTMLYLASLFMAFIIWLIVKQGEIETRQIDVGIYGIDVPGNCEVEIEPSSALVEVQCPNNQLNFVVACDIPIINYAFIGRMFRLVDGYDGVIPITEDSKY